MDFRRIVCACVAGVLLLKDVLNHDFDETMIYHDERASWIKISLISD